MKINHFLVHDLMYYCLVMCLSTGDVLYELLQHIMKQRKPHTYFSVGSFHSLTDPLQPHRLEGETQF